MKSQLNTVEKQYFQSALKLIKSEQYKFLLRSKRYSIVCTWSKANPLKTGIGGATLLQQFQGKKLTSILEWPLPKAIFEITKLIQKVSPLSFLIGKSFLNLALKIINIQI